MIEPREILPANDRTSLMVGYELAHRARKAKPRYLKQHQWNEMVIEAGLRALAETSVRNHFDSIPAN